MNIDKWAINESLLQAYRSTFVSSQSFLLAVGAIFSGKSHVLVYITVAVGLAVTWLIWFPVVRARHRIVDYYKFGHELTSAERSQICSEHDYVHDRAKRDQTNISFNIKTNWRKTRLKLDFGMPALFSIVWIALMINEAIPPDFVFSWPNF